MAHDQDDVRSVGRQFIWRSRTCLLKGCERVFRPSHPRSRYCGDECRCAARRWSRAKAQQRHRATEKSRTTRRKQSCLYRLRYKSRRKPVAALTEVGREGDHKPNKHNFLCQRPGCYELVLPSKRSPLQKYCSKPCRHAMRRVLERERHWFSRVTPQRASFSVP
jgi:hypothetical protein